MGLPGREKVWWYLQPFLISRGGLLTSPWRAFDRRAFVRHSYVSSVLVRTNERMRGCELSPSSLWNFIRTQLYSLAAAPTPRHGKAIGCCCASWGILWHVRIGCAKRNVQVENVPELYAILSRWESFAVCRCTLTQAAVLMRSFISGSCIFKGKIRVGNRDGEQ